MEDLSDYERLRLENIRRNQSFLASLGIEKEAKPLNSATVNDTPAKKKRKATPVRVTLITPTRKSPRLQQLEAEKASIDLPEDSNDDNNEEGEDNPEGIDYTSMPLESEELDDEEFQVYAELKAWRLKTCRSLDIEPYKICQNRTLAEMIRRRRNDMTWASVGQRDAVQVSDDLLDCWGLGPAKVCPGGFGYQLAEVLERESVQELLEKSRRRPDPDPLPEADSQ